MKQNDKTPILLRLFPSSGVAKMVLNIITQLCSALYVKQDMQVQMENVPSPIMEIVASSEPGTKRCSRCSGLMKVSGTGIRKSGMYTDPFEMRSTKYGV